MLKKLSVLSSISPIIISIILVGLLQMAYSTEVQVLTVEPGVVRTFTLNLDNGAKFKGSLSVAGGAGNDIDFMVKDPAGNPIISQRRVAEGWSFDFTANSSGAYTLYFDNSFSILSSKQVNLSYDIQKPIIPGSPVGGGCLIATAAFGSELAPQVQFLREFRDHRIMQTEAGKNFMIAFNAWYYSFSPYVADYERSNTIVKESVKYIIYPLIGILNLSEKGFHISSNAEYSTLFSGFVASSMIGAVYFTPFASFVKQLRMKRPNNLLFAVLGGTTIMLLIAISVGNSLLLIAATSFFVLSTIASFSIFSAYGISTLCRKFQNKNQSLQTQILNKPVRY